MSFFDLQRYRREQYDLERAVRDNKLLEERIKHLKWQEQTADYDREQQHYREQEKRRRQRESDLEYISNQTGEIRHLKAELEDLKLRRKFGIEGGA